jgi:7-cyano-7-deazaguanine synthase
MGLDYNLSWTCYNGREKACGKCGACQERLEAFTENGVTDPLEYEG